MNEQEPKAPRKKPKKRLKDLKKPLLSSGIIATTALSGFIVGVVLFINIERPRGGTFIMGYSGGFTTIDPLNFEDDPMIISQIAEPLFTEWSNQTSLFNENVPHLAKEGNWSDDYLNFTCSLKEGIEFHDGTKFNATAVKWNFDRLQHLLVSISYPFIWYSDGIQILNRTEVIDDYIVRFVLNRPFVPFKSLLTYYQAYILSPKSTPFDRFLDVSTEKIIGTGPYIYESNVVGINTTITKNKNYWGTPKPIIDTFVFLRLNYIESNERFFARETHYAVGNDSYIEKYKKDSTIVVNDFVDRGFWFLGMNNKRIDTPMRKAISYALNYSDILELQDSLSWGSNIRCRSPLALGTLYSNWEDFNLPYYNISMARQALKEVNWPGTINLTVNDNITSGNDWEMKANSPTPLGPYNISYIIGDTTMRAEVPSIVTESLKQIGVKIETFPLTAVDYWGQISSGRIDLFFVGWGVLYNDPSFTINLMFSSKSDGWQNFQQTNDSLIHEWMEEGLVQQNPTLRNGIYFNIQKRLIEEVYPVVWLYSSVWYDVYRTNLRGWGYWGAGAFKNLYFI
ncbi:MAG: ABC transporter substrate-binding protein [Promethearchaeota archaeon]